MLTATLSKDRIVVSGHALFAPKGEDIVCAAVSGIVLGTKSIFKNKGMIVDKKNATISLLAQADHEEQQAALKVVAKQLQEVAKGYPQHVRIIRER